MHPSSTNINQLMFSLSHPSIAISHPDGITLTPTARSPSGGFWVEDLGQKLLKFQASKTQRVGVGGDLIFGRDYLNERPKDSQRIESVFPVF